MQDKANKTLKEYIISKKNLHYYLIKYLESTEEKDNENINYRELEDFLKDYFNENKDEFEHFLLLIIQLANNHHRANNFISKIKIILEKYKKKIKDTFANFEIYSMFRNNKLLLLFLFQNKIIEFDDTICKEILDKKDYNGTNYSVYFFKEIEDFCNKERWEEQQKVSKEICIKYKKFKEIEKEVKESSYYENIEIYRNEGENHGEICSLIRQDLVQEFITYVNKNNIALNYLLKSSEFETNRFLIKHKPNLIEYATFFGSIQIFNYLRLQNGVKLSQSLWIYAIHGKNADIIHLLEDNKIWTSDDDNISFERLFIESIKCHHNDVATYLFDNYISNSSNIYNESFYASILKYHNYAFLRGKFNEEDTLKDKNIFTIKDIFNIKVNFNIEDLFFYLCSYNYRELVSFYLTECKEEIDGFLILNQ